MKPTAFLAAALTVALSLVTVGGIATAADQDETNTAAHAAGPAARAPQRVVSNRPLMRLVPDQRVAGIVDHVAPSCTGDGTDGKRVQVLYVRSATAPSDFAETRPQILDELRTVDDVFAASAAKTGGGLRVRWVYGPDCVPVVKDVGVSRAALGDPFDVMKAELQAQGYNRSDRKYLVFSESHQNCGLSDGNITASVSRIDAMCWPLRTTSFAAHELGHALGAVAGDAPHASGWGHCTETGDLMCNGQRDPSDKAVRACPGWQSNWFDCGNDDYFSTDPAPGSYLDSDHNIARSPYLDTVAPLADVPEIRVTARSERLRTGGGRVVVVRASTREPVLGWRFPAAVGGCRLTSSLESPRVTAEAGTATYSCRRNVDTKASFTIQALGLDDRVGYASAGVVSTRTVGRG